MDARPAPTTDEVLLERRGALGRIVLNRPRAINALTLPMVQAVQQAIEEWSADDAVGAITIEGAGERGLCAGGDVVAVRRAMLEGGDHTAFFRAEYEMNDAIAGCSTPVVAFQDGIVMGGGVGVSAFARHRLVTPRSKVAMPETIIGFFPDVGAMYLLSRTPGELGTHLALTGSAVGGADAIAAGLSDALVEESDWEPLLDRLAEGGSAEGVGSVPSSSALLDARPWIDECYAGDDAGAVVQRLESSGVEAAREAGALLRQRSPVAVAATLAGLRRAAGMGSVREVLDQDLVLAGHMVAEGDFVEGVRAQLVDKDRTPSFQDARVEDVSAERVASYFR